MPDNAQAVKIEEEETLPPIDADDYCDFKQVFNYPNAQGRTVGEVQVAINYYNKRHPTECMIAVKDTGGLYEIDFKRGVERKLKAVNLRTKLTTDEIHWVSMNKKGNLCLRQPEMNVFESVATASPVDLKKLPRYSGLFHGVLLRRDGTVCSKRGFDKDTNLICVAALKTQKVPETPTEADVAKAKEIIYNLLREFRFAHDVDESIENSVAFQNAVFFLFAAVLRPCWKGPFPIFVISKNSERIGASLLSDTISTMAYGETYPRLTFSTREEENEKAFRSMMTESPLYCTIDNIKPDTEWVFPSMLTASSGGKDTKVNFRKLGTNDMIHAEPRTIISVNGIRVKTSADITGRIVVINLRSQRSWQETEKLDRTKNELLEEAKEAHPDVIWAFATMIRFWHQHGEPDALPPNGNFSEYADLYNFIGGVMRSCGYTNYLRNLAEIQTSQNDYEVNGRKVLELLQKQFDFDKFKLGGLKRHLQDCVRSSKEDYNYDYEQDLSAFMLTMKQVENIDNLNEIVLGKVIKEYLDRAYFGCPYILRKGSDESGKYYWLSVDGKPPLPKGIIMTPEVAGLTYEEARELQAKERANAEKSIV